MCREIQPGLAGVPYVEIARMPLGPLPGLAAFTVRPSLQPRILPPAGFAVPALSPEPTLENSTPLCMPRGTILRRCAVCTTPNAWSRSQATRVLPVDSALRFELRLGRCEGRETRVQLMGGATLRSSPSSAYRMGDESWSWCRWQGLGLRNLSASAAFGEDGYRAKGEATAAEDVGWHAIVQLVTSKGVEVYEDGVLRLTVELPEGAPRLAAST